MYKVLVAYASKHQSTEEIAKYIGSLLERRDFDVHVLDVDEVTSLGDYSAVILGSAVYIGQWLKSANNFIRHYQNDLANIPVWIFSTGPTGVGNPDDLLDGFLIPEKLQDVIQFIEPRHVTLFHGRLDRARLGIGERMIIRTVNAPVGDFRDWDMIRAWTNRIIAELQAEPLVKL